MRWILIFLLIGCTDSDDMRLFQTSLPSGGETPPPVIIDGGELIALTPDLPLGEPNKGFTNTGLFYCQEESEARTDGKLIFWSSNWGRKDNATAGGRFESIVKLAIDYQVGGGGVGDRYTAELLENINTYKTQTGGSMQGMFQRSDGRVYVSDSGVRGYEPYADGSGDAILVNDLSGISGLGPALAYDKTNDTFLGGNTLTVSRYDFSGNLIETLPFDLSGLTADIDQISVNTDENVFSVAYGAYGLKYFNYTTYAEIKQEDLAGRSIDIEGICLVRSPYPDDNLYVFINSDNWFHSDGNPDTDINAVHKVTSTVFTP